MIGRNRAAQEGVSDEQWSRDFARGCLAQILGVIGILAALWWVISTG